MTYRIAWLSWFALFSACAAGGTPTGTRDLGGSIGRLDATASATDGARPVDGASTADGATADAARDGATRDGAARADSGFDAQVRGLTCDTCLTDSDCDGDRICEVVAGAKACLPTCNLDLPSCNNRRFVCSAIVGRVTGVCLPSGVPCCVDEDMDMFGYGVGCMGPDCDDNDALRNPSRTDLCDGRENDCDAELDETPTNCVPTTCRLGASGYEQVGGEMCTGGRCVAGASTPCGLYACDGTGAAGMACATRCNPAGPDNDAYCAMNARCFAGTCVAVRCGDGFVDIPRGEECDDGNTSSGDGCSGDCRSVECVGLGAVTVLDPSTKSCYWRSTTVVGSRDQAAQGCAANRGHLVYLETAQERQTLYQTIGFSGSSRVYVGLRATRGGEFGPNQGQWENGMNLTYDFFDGSEPSGDGSCTEWGPGLTRGNDIPCDTSRDYVCERERPGMVR